MPSRIGLMLDMSARQLERVIYYEDYIVIDPGNTPLEPDSSSPNSNSAMLRKSMEWKLSAGMGAEAVRDILSQVELAKLFESSKKRWKTRSKQVRKKLAKRLKLAQGFTTRSPVQSG